ncbi:MAG: sigma-54-dependent Fis family transcriptional regulator [Prolixibacteraceae bacterium]|nr:sigma-54-dependent Fis family transcriptional regulator [Prolixibacteraceae bacterium]
MSKTKGHILIVDDNASILNSLQFLLQHHFEKITTIRSPNQILNVLKSEYPDVILLDMNYAAGVNTGNEGIYWLHKILEAEPNAIVVLITAYGDVELAIRAIKEGAVDFILKPWENNKLLATLQSALSLSNSKKQIRHLQLKEKQLKEDASRGFTGIIGESEVMLDLHKTIHKVAKTDASILLLGENGTGKELVAREIHRLSKRSQNDFVSVDLGALAETLIESELFGHVKGAYTDAREDRIGRFEAADKGTLFLDEIANLSYPMQAKLLTAIEQRKITSLGSNRPVNVDIRIISATNKDIKTQVKQRMFREDLFYRINTIQLEISPLRIRGDDIILLAEHYLHEFSTRYDRKGIKFSNESLKKLKVHQWPGNVRELRHTIEKAVILAETTTLMPEDFSFVDDKLHLDFILPRMKLDEVEKNMISLALRNNNGNIAETARELGIGRQTLYRKIEKYEL